MRQTLQTLYKKPVAMAGVIASGVQNAKKRMFAAQSLVQAEKTPFDLIYEEDIVRLRYYPPLRETAFVVDGQILPVVSSPYRVPLVLVAPLAVNMFIYDLFPHRSLVKYLRGCGFELYLIDWGRPTQDHNHFSLQTYYGQWMPKLLAKVREHSGQQEISLHGWSLGGLFCVCYAAMGDPHVANLVLVGAPGDYHANGVLGRQYQRLARSLRWLDEHTGWRIHNTRKRWWRSPGWANALAFKLTNPVASVRGYLDLLRNLHDQDYVVAHATNGAFLDDMVAYPGAVMQDVIQFLLTDNLVAKGKVPSRAGQALSLRAIVANVLAVCGRADPIVTRECTAAILAHVSSADTRLMDVEGGHMGILAGSKAPSQIWPEVAQWLSQRSN